jgi:rod shape-determining protein MreD
MKNNIQFTSILLTGFLTVFLEATLDWPRQFLRFQPDILPIIIIYAAIYLSPLSILALSILFGWWLDSFSLNPFGISAFPLTIIGLIMNRFHELILYETTTGQIVLGFFAGFLAPVLAIILMLGHEPAPIVSHYTFLYCLGNGIICGLVLPGIFKLFNLLIKCFAYPEATSSSFRPDREIKRGKY